MIESKIFENHHFIITKRLLMVTCIWPYQNQKLKCYGRAFIIFAIHTMIVPQMIRLYKEWYKDVRNIQVLVENFMGFLYFQGVLSKLYMCMFVEKKLRYLYEEMSKDHEEIQESMDRAAMVKLWNFARFLSIIYASYGVIGLFFFVFTPQMVPAILDMMLPLNESRPKTICYYAEYFIDQDKYLPYLVLHSFVAVAISILIVVAVDTSFVSVSYHVLGLFNLIIRRFQYISEWADDDVHRKDEEIHDFVIDTIKIHNKTIELAKMVRLAHDKGNFVVFSLILVGLSFGTINILMNLTNPEIILRIGFLWLGVILYLFYVNWPGQRFLDSSDDLSKSIYFCNWYKLPKETQFLLRFMMMRCLKPCQLTAGPLFQLSFAYFSSILRTALSYFMTVFSLI